ncbi:phosphate ABC transporter permease subunit PstC [Candidatus Kaiserbacteria bacterium]|nr:phosphate ABC transporter permease subunit PstC [Candidatus Kaiserbacteria bacterium]
MRYPVDTIARTILLLCAVQVVIVILGVFLFLGLKAFNVFGQGATITGFLFDTHWDPMGLGSADGIPAFGAGGLILGSLVITLGSVLIATPLSIGLALFLTDVSSPVLQKIFRPILEVFTGVPSVVIGFYGLVVVVPLLQALVGNLTGNHVTAGYGWGAAIIVLVIMILPTITSISIDALRAVPGSVREASLALGATRWQMMMTTVVPAAAAGLATAVVLGMARAIGETLAVSLVLAGHRVPSWDQPLFNIFFQPNVNITQYIAIDFGESYGAGRDAYFTLAFVLLLTSFIFVVVSRRLSSKKAYL